MESALAWINAIFQWIGQFIPRWAIVRTTHGAVKFIRGSKVVALGPGFHFYWPLLTDFEVYPTARQAADLRTQTIVTQDERTIVVGGLIVYEVADLEAILARTFDPDQTVKDIALSAIHDVISQLTWAEIREQQKSGALERELRREVKKHLDGYGVRVLKTMLTDLAPCRVLKLIQTMAQDGI